ncbi:MAG: hypothetical protein RLZZ127_2159, partial [Planctomycetota bacterium]
PARSASLARIAENRWLLRPDALPALGPGATHGALANAIIEDESGKADAATLGEEGWARLLAAVGIVDWEGDPRWRWYDSPPAATDVIRRDPQGYEIYGEWQRQGNRGQLARALAQAGLQLPDSGYRLVHLDQLLQVDPARLPALSPWIPMMRIDNPTGWEVNRRDPHFAERSWSGTVPPPDRHRVPDPTNAPGGRRQPLTRAELERLRPYLTVHAPAQARAGMVDLGTSLGIFDTDPGSGTSLATVLDYQGAYPQDQWLVGARPQQTDPSKANLGIVETSGNNNTTVRGIGFSAGSVRLAEAGEGLAFLLPRPVNPNTAAGPVRQALAITASTVATAIHALEPLTRANPLAVIDPVAAPPVSAAQEGAIHPGLDPQGAGVVTIESHGAGFDGAARRTAGEQRRAVVQAVDQEDGAVREWKTQADWQALVWSRQASGMISAPIPDRRTGSPRLIEALERPTGPLGQFDQPGRLVAGPLTAFSRNDAWPATWRVDFGAIQPVSASQADRPAVAGDNRTDPSGAQVALVEDGARLTGAGIAGYLLAATGAAPIPLGPRAGPGPVGSDGSGLDACWISLHVRFDDPDRSATLLSARAPVAGSATTTLGVELSGVAASNESQHRWELIYDPTLDEGRLRLVVANGAIPQSGSTGIQIGRDDPQTELLDERATGSSGPFPADLLQRDPIGAAGSALSAPELRVRFKPVADRWYHLLIVQVNDQPGGTVVLIDGLLGDDWAATGGALAKQGDYVTLPSLRLVTPLPAKDISLTGGAGLYEASITLEAPEGLSVEDLLPARGLIRIHDEYISYGGISGNALTHCVRARRVNTNAADPSECWPLTQDHPAGSRVLPGWYRYDTASGQLYPGSTALAQDLGTGDESTTYDPPQSAGWTPGPTLSGTYHALADLRASATPANLRFRTWAWVNAPAPRSNGSGIRDVPLSGTMTLHGAVGRWPSRGRVRILRQDGSLVADQWYRDAAPSPTTIELDGSNGMVEVLPDEALLALVTSVRIADDPVGFNLSASDKAVQITAPDGRVEWLRYDSATRSAEVSGYYLLDDTGFPYVRNALDTFRGSMRTAFLDETSRLPFGTMPVGSPVLPVQDESANHNLYGLEPGDVVTLVPTVPWRPDLRPVQMQVRFSASDGFAWAPPAQARFDTKNQWFAFTQPISASAPRPSQGLAVVVGRGWTGVRTMSTDSYNPPSTGLMPRVEAWGDGFAAWGDPLLGPRVTLGPDRDRGSPNPDDLGFVVDGLGAGRLAGLQAHRPGGNGIVSLGGGSLAGIPAAGGLPIGATAAAGVNLFARPQGLVLIDGEVFAYRRPGNNSNEAILIARGLLGTTMAPHTLTRSSTFAGKAAQGQLAAIPLPIGPIGILGDRSALGAVTDGPIWGHADLPADAPIGHSIRTSPVGRDLFGQD